MPMTVTRPTSDPKLSDLCSLLQGRRRLTHFTRSQTKHRASLWLEPHFELGYERQRLNDQMS
jgi:hypothetical protein